MSTPIIRSPLDRLIDESILIAARAAIDYGITRKLTLGGADLHRALTKHVAAKMDEATTDAKNCYGMGLSQMAEVLFVCSMMQAGILAAKEASQTKTVQVELTSIN